jgi:small subunit ribosomal protein S17e
VLRRRACRPRPARRAAAAAPRPRFLGLARRRPDAPRRARAPRRPPQASKAIIEAYYSRLTLDFNTNKRVAEEVAIIPTKRLRNKIAGFTTHVMKRIQRGPVRGISLKLQEEERERRMDFVPDQSAINTEVIEVDRDSMDMLRSLNCASLPGLVVTTTTGNQGGGGFKGGFQGGDRGPRRDARQ